MSKNLVVLLFLACSLWQCTDNIDLGNEISPEYYPVKVGNYWVYDVSDETYINQFLHDPVDSIAYQVRERVDSVFRDQTGELTYRVIRSRRSGADQPWANDSIITINKSGSDLRYTGNNLKIVKMVLPVKANKKWNGNAFNSRDPEEFSFTQVGQPFTLGDSTYHNTVRVEQALFESAVGLDDRYEVYALGVGMIYKKVVDLRFCWGPDQNCPDGFQYILYGRRINHKLIAYGTLQ
jgi:hypothetical protein